MHARGPGVRRGARLRHVVDKDCRLALVRVDEHPDAVALPRGGGPEVGEGAVHHLFAVERRVEACAEVGRCAPPAQHVMAPVTHAKVQVRVHPLHRQPPRHGRRGSRLLGGCWRTGGHGRGAALGATARRIENST